MEPAMTAEGGARSGPGRLTLGHVLASSWAVWSSHPGPIVGAVLLLHVPVALVGLLPESTSPAGLGLGLFSSLVLVVASMAQTGAVTLAGLRALRGEPLRVRGLVTEGLRRAWLTFKVGFLSWWVVAVLFLVLFLVARANLPWVLTATPRALEAQIWFLATCKGIGWVAVMAWYFPAVPLALSHPELGARSAVRHARELTQGARVRLVAIALAFECLSLPTWLSYRWAGRLAAGGEKTLALVALGALAVVIASFINLGRVLVHRALRHEREGAAADLDGLERVFE